MSAAASNAISHITFGIGTSKQKPAIYQFVKSRLNGCIKDICALSDLRADEVFWFCIRYNGTRHWVSIAPQPELTVICCLQLGLTLQAQLGELPAAKAKEIMGALDVTAAHLIHLT